MLEEYLHEYIRDPENPETNWNLAMAYLDINQTASAYSFLQRCADRSRDNLDLAYECLIHIGFIFDRQGNRLEHVRCMYRHAISLLPRRPEAYYMLANFDNWNKGYPQSYHVCRQALELCDFDSPPFRRKCRYPGKWGVIYENVVTCWHYGKLKEYRLGLTDLHDNYLDKMDEVHANDVVAKYNAVTEQYNSKSIIDKFYEDLNTIEWGIYNNNPKLKEFTYLELTHGIYNKFFDVEAGDVVFDIGACVGLYPLTILKNNPKEIHCFEPNTSLFNAMEKNLKGFDNVYLNHYGIGKSKGRTLKIDDENEKYGYLTTFKDYVKENNINKIDVLKTDCEGGEWDIFTRENYSWITNNVRKVSGEFHLHWNSEFLEKFKNFRDTYLRNAKNVIAFVSNEYAAVKQINIWDDDFLRDNCDYMNLSFELVPGSISVETEETKVLTPRLNPSICSTESAWVVDNFYKDPDAIRAFGLEQDYHIGGIGRGYIGNRTHEQFLFPGLKERFENIMGKKITKWEEYGMNGRFQYCWSGQPQVWHCDSQMWGGMIYLTPDAPYECGTTLYAHKGNRARTYYDEGYDVEWRNVEGDPHLDGTQFEPVDVFGNVYNRLVIFDASCIHSSSGYFGTVKENCRFWQMFFFDAE